MPIIRAQVEIGADTALPRDRLVNVLWFNESTTGLPDLTDWEDLATDILDTYDPLVGTTRQVQVKLYNMDDAAPRQPKAIKTKNPDVFPESNLPRELALCLSFRGEVNAPRSRGRIYVPALLLGNEADGRPTTAKMNAVLALAGRFADIGGVDVDWVVHSQIMNTTAPVKSAWVDNEWDVQRRRGMRSTDRVTTALDE